MYIINGYECDCVFYANENHVRVCYNNEEECFYWTNQYKYKYKNQCLLGNETDCKFKLKGKSYNNYLQKCFPSKKECSDNNYYFFDENTCWASWPTGKFANALNSSYLPGLDNKGNICVLNALIHIHIIHMIVKYANWVVILENILIQIIIMNV